MDGAFLAASDSQAKSVAVSVTLSWVSGNYKVEPLHPGTCGWNGDPACPLTVPEAQ